MASNNSAALTVDGFIGPGITLQAKVFSNVAKFGIDVIKGTLEMTDVNGKVSSIALGTPATMTVAISGGNYTVTIAD